MMTTHTYFALAFLVSTCSNVMIAASTSVNTTDKLNTSTPTSSTSTLSSLIPTAPPAAQSPVSTSTQSTNKSTTLHTSTNPIKPTTTFNTTTTSQKTSTSPMQKTTSKADFPEDTSGLLVEKMSTTLKITVETSQNPSNGVEASEELRAENKTLKTAVGILSGVIGAAVLVAVVLLFVRHRRRSRRRDPLDDNDEPTMRRNRNYFRPPSNPESVPSRLYSTSESEPMTPADKEMETFYVKNGGDKNENSTFKS